MLTTLQVYNQFVNTAPLPIGDGMPSTDPIQVRNIDGLGPVAATLSSTAYGTVDGELLTGASVGKRNIVITFGLNPNWLDQTMSSLRQILYQYFMPKSTVDLWFETTDLPMVKITGTVESLEPNIFSNDPEIQVSIICFDPYFTDMELTVEQGQTQALDSSVYETITYKGNITTGFLLDVAANDTVTSSVGEFRIAESTPSMNSFSVAGVTINATNTLEINTVPGNKYIHSVANATGTFQNILGKLNVNSTWPVLAQGDNVFWFLSATAGLDWTLSYYARYGGL